MTTMMMCDGRDADGGGDGACTALVATHCCSRSKRVCFLWVYVCILSCFYSDLSEILT